MSFMYLNKHYRISETLDTKIELDVHVRLSLIFTSSFKRLLCQRILQEYSCSVLLSSAVRALFSIIL